MLSRRRKASGSAVTTGPGSSTGQHHGLIGLIARAGRHPLCARSVTHESTCQDTVLTTVNNQEKITHVGKEGSRLKGLAYTLSD
jgi:hypothetical protein